MQELMKYGLTLKQHKSAILTTPIQIYGNTCTLIIPVNNQAEILVTVGQQLDKFQQIAKAGQLGGSAVYTHFSGRVVAVMDIDHPFFGLIKAVEIIPDNEQNSTPQNIEKAEVTSSNIIIAIQKAGIIDGLDGRPLDEKLKEFADKSIQTIAVNAIEDEPFVCSSSALILQNSGDIALGLSLAAQVVGATNKEIYTYRSKSYDEMKSRLSQVTQIFYLTGKYPVKKRFVDSKPDVGFIGAQACLDLLAAVDSASPQTMMLITVAGDCVTNPCNIWVPIGMTVASLLNFCGLREQPDVVVMGGSITGKLVEDLSMPLGVGIPALLALKIPPIPDISNCCGCADCVRCCPQRLMPVYISRFARHGQFDECEAYGAERCIECGCCSYVCRGGIDPAAFTALAKNEIINARKNKSGGKDNAY